MAVLRSALILLWLATSSGCGGSSQVREYLDSETAATVMVATGEWVFARERTDLAVNARDYVTLTPVMSNRNGKRTLLIHCQIWSTIDRRNSEIVVADQAAIVLVANDRPIPLNSSSESPQGLGFGRPPVLPANSKAQVRWVGVEVAVLRYIEQAQSLRIVGSNPLESFRLWRVDRAAIATFLDNIDPK